MHTVYPFLEGVVGPRLKLVVFYPCLVCVGWWLRSHKSQIMVLINPEKVNTVPAPHRVYQPSVFQSLRQRERYTNY